MIVVRDVLLIHPEHMKDAKASVGELQAIGKRLGYSTGRALVDLTGEYYTLVLESEFNSLGAYEESLKKVLADKEWQDRYGRVRPMIRGGRREVYQVVE